MANLAQIQSIAQGQFFVKDSLGNLTELKVGDTVSLNDTIVAASSNTDLSKIEILFDTNELITLSQGEQLLDTTLLASTFGNEELAFDKQEVDETLNAWNNAQDGDATDMETAAGDVTEQATNAGDENAQDGGALRSKFNSRDGASTNVESDLRDTSFGGGNTEEPQEQIPTELLNPAPVAGETPAVPETGTPTEPTPTEPTPTEPTPTEPTPTEPTPTEPTPTEPTPTEPTPTEPTPTIPVDTRVPASVITLSDSTVDEGKQITITATVTNPPQTDLIITLDNGQTITISAGQTTGNTTFTNPNSEDVYVDNSTETYTITGTTGGNYVSLDTSDSSVVIIEDTDTQATVTITANPVQEGENIVFTATVDADKTPKDAPLVISVKDSNENEVTTITIPVGQTTGSSNPVTNPNGEDVYEDGSTLNYTTEVKSGGTEYELPLNTTPVSVVVTDTDTQATVTITANPVQEGENIVFTATVDADKTPKDAPLVISVKDSNENEVTTITIPVGQTTGSSNPVTNPNGEDVYEDGSTLNYTTEVKSGGTEYELPLNTTPVSVVVTDTDTQATVTITANPVQEGENIVFTATVDADKTPKDAPLVISVKDSNENEVTTITIPVGQTTGSSNPVTNPNGEDVYEDGSTLNYTTEVKSGGTEYELPLNTTPVSVVVTDTDTQATVTITANPVQEGENIVFTATVDADKTPKDAPLVISVKDSNENEVTTITIPVGQTTGSSNPVTNPNGEDVYEDGSTLNYTTEVKSGGTEYELPLNTTPVSVVVTDTDTQATVTITATVTTPKIIDVNTKLDGSTGVEMYVESLNGKADLSVIKGTNHDGFGVLTTDQNGKSVNKSNGDTKELGVGEKIVVEFTNDKDVNSLDVSFAWRNNHETAKLTFVKDTKVVGYATVDGDRKSTTKAIVKYYDEKENLVKEVNAKGSSDKVDEAFTFELPDTNGGIVSFDKVEFSAPQNKDDYLIHKISYKEVLDTEVTDIITDGGNVTFNIQMDEKYPPQGKATATVKIGDKEYIVDLNATGRGTLTLDSSKLGTDLSNVVAEVKKVTGGNYENVELKTERFDFTPTLKSTDDSITTDEDVPYTLTINDFGDISESTTEFKITEVPTNGKLTLSVTTGETIFDKEGNKIEATQDSKVEITEDQIITLGQVGAGKVEFVPKENSDVDGSFKFQVGDGNGNFSTEYTTTIDVIAVADAPEASVNNIDTTTVSQSLGEDIDLSGLTSILEEQKTGDIDLSKNGSQDKLTLTLDDVLKLSDDNKIKITGDEFDSVTLKNEEGKTWQEGSPVTEDSKTFETYTNSGDPTVQVKVEEKISDGVTS